MKYALNSRGDALASLVGVMRFALDALHIIFSVARRYLKVDRWIAASLVIFALIYLPGLTRATSNPQLLAAFSNDEPWITMALDATRAKPYGNPANFFDVRRESYSHIPPYWGSLRYPGITYYGGAEFTVAAPFYALARLIGLPAFPTAPIILRAISLLASAFSLIILYNIALCQNLHRAAGLFAGLFLMGNSYFYFYTSVIHPDTLQMLFGLLAFVLALEHSERGDLRGLAALGIVCGLVQGSKSGGPWTIPMAIFALLWGARAGGVRLSEWRPILGRFVVLGVASFAGYFVSTPYAFLDPYLFQSFVAQWHIVASDATPFGVVTIWSWITGIWADVGSVAGVIVVATVLVQLAFITIGKSKRATTLALILCTTQLFWFGLLGKLWVVPGYLLVAYGLLSVWSFDLLFSIIRRLCARISYLAGKSPAVSMGLTGLSFLIVGLFMAPGLLEAAVHTTSDRSYRLSTQFALNRWATATLPHTARILFDDIAYFDPNVFPNAKMNGGVLTWRRVIGQEPQYIILASSLYDAPWIAKLRHTQHRSQMDPDEFSVRLYQDLLASDELGPTQVQGVELMKIIAPPPFVRPAPSSRPEAREHLGLLDVIGRTDRGVRRLIAALELQASKPLDPIEGVTLRIYRLNPPGGPNGRPAAFASSEAAEYPARYAFDGTTSAWEAKDNNKSFIGEYAGYDFGDHHPRSASGVEIKWVTAPVTPSAIRIEYSDDRLSWTSVGGFSVAPYGPSDPAFRVDRFNFEETAEHRFWRVVDEDDRVIRGFGVADIRLLGGDGDDS